MTKKKIQPAVKDLKTGSYFWCSCGKSEKDPMCESPEECYENEQKPVILTITGKEKCALCMCKKTKKPPYCDGSHQAL